MPHSSGGGSHGGGSHGGSHGGSSNHVSTHYFAGSRRYRRYNRRTGKEEYVYAERMPQKTGIGSFIVIGAMAIMFITAFFSGVKDDIPQKLGAHYTDLPAVYDNIDVINDDDALKETLESYQELTGICPVIYTVFDDVWNYSYADLESYTFDAYVSSFSDEEHFVIVYSISKEDRELMNEWDMYIPDYAWEAVQGDYTDPILTENVFRSFADTVQEALERGSDPGIAFDEGFKYLSKDAGNKLSPFSISRVLTLGRVFFPLVIIAAFFGLFLFTMIKSYIRDKDVVYYEVPLDEADRITGSGSAKDIFDSYRRNHEAGRSTAAPKAAKAGLIISMIFITPFVLSGLGMIISAVFMMRNVDTGTGGFMLIFGSIWTLISGAMLCGMIINLVKSNKKKEPTPLTSEYPDMKPVEPVSVPYPSGTSVQSSSADLYEPEFDPQFFGSAKSDYESDDEDYKRMKRQGYE